MPVMENYTTVVYSSSSATHTSRHVLQILFGDTEVVLRLVFGVFLCEIVSLCGLVTNVIVMAVFYRQGIMAESSTVSLFALALADLLVQLAHIAIGIADAMIFAEENGFIGVQYISPMLIRRIAFFQNKIVMGHVICWLTAYLSFERCFSVLFPFKVKLIFSPKTSLIAVICVFVGTIFTFIPLTARFGVTERTVNNMTIITSVSHDIFSKELIKAAVMLNPIILRNLAIIIVVLSNILILIKVKSSTAWRKSNASSTVDTNDAEDKTKRNNAFQKEAKLMKMISMISAIFLFCTAPDMIAVVLIETGFAAIGNPTWFAIYGVVFFLESVNSCVNIFVYYFMSTSFNKGFKQLFGKT